MLPHPSICWLILLSVVPFGATAQSNSSHNKTSELYRIQNQLIEDIYKLPTDYEQLKPGEEFLFFPKLGIPFTTEELSYIKIPGSYLTIPAEIDKAYRFSKWVNELYILDNDISTNGTYLDQILDTEIKQYTSATYDDTFSYVDILPYFDENSYSEKRMYNYAFKKCSGSCKTNNNTEIDCSTYIVTYKINKIIPYRLWYSGDVKLENAKHKTAFIKELIYAELFEIFEYNGHPPLINGDNSQYQNLITAELFNRKMVIGLVLRVL